MSNRLISFTLIREGPSDDGLIPHLRTLIVNSGADEAVGSTRRYKGTTQERLRLLKKEEADVDIVFVHRDADSRSAAERLEEVESAGLALGLFCPLVAVVPVQELEAWLLLSESEIRSVVGRPRGKVELGLPKLNAIERTANPKEVLAEALVVASESAGRRLTRERKAFARRRSMLLQRPDMSGPIRSLPAWQRLEKDMLKAVGEVLAGKYL